MRRLIIISLVVSLICLLLVTIVSGYVCINNEDNDGVKQFKSNMNILDIKQDLDKGITEEAILLKLKYFGHCR